LTGSSSESSRAIATSKHFLLGDKELRREALPPIVGPPGHRKPGARTASGFFVEHWSAIIGVWQQVS
jgi:hypothetical protein